LFKSTNYEKYLGFNLTVSFLLFTKREKEGISQRESLGNPYIVNTLLVDR